MTTDLTELARGRQTRWWLWSFALFILMVPIGAFVGYLVVADGDHGWFFVVLAGLTVLYLLLILAFLFWRRRRGARWAQPPLLLGMDRGRRKGILKSVRAGEPVAEPDQAIAADVAERLARQKSLIYLVPVLVLVWILQLLTRGFDTASVFLLFGIGLNLISWPFTLRDVRRGREWLEKYGSTAD